MSRITPVDLAGPELYEGTGSDPRNTVGLEAWIPSEAAPLVGVDRTVPSRLFTLRYTRWQLLRSRIGEWVQHLGRRISG